VGGLRLFVGLRVFFYFVFWSFLIRGSPSPDLNPPPPAQSFFFHSCCGFAGIFWYGFFFGQTSCGAGFVGRLFFGVFSCSCASLFWVPFFPPAPTLPFTLEPPLCRFAIVSYSPPVFFPPPFFVFNVLTSLTDQYFFFTVPPLSLNPLFDLRDSFPSFYLAVWPVSFSRCFLFSTPPALTQPFFFPSPIDVAPAPNDSSLPCLLRFSVGTGFPATLSFSTGGFPSRFLPQEAPPPTIFLCRPPSLFPKGPARLFRPFTVPYCVHDFFVL